MDIFNSPEDLPEDRTLESALNSVTNDWRLTNYAASICSVNVLAVISRRQLRNEILSLRSSYYRYTKGGDYVRDRRGVAYKARLTVGASDLVNLPDDPTVPGTNGEFLISFRELGDTRVAIVRVNPTPDLAPPKVVTI